MACGVQKTVTYRGSPTTLTCNNAGTSAHAGAHTATTSAFYGLVSQQWAWYATDTVVTKQKTIVVGDDAP